MNNDNTVCPRCGQDSLVYNIPSGLYICKYKCGGLIA